MTLPPFLRVIQQSYVFHIFVAALIAGGSIAFVCFGKNSEISWECLKAGLYAGAAYLGGILAQHSPGSASFVQEGPHAGTVNQPVQQVVEMQKMNIPVKVSAGK